MQNSGGGRIIQASHADLGYCWLYIDRDAPLLFTENETNNQRLFGGQNASAYVKDGINDYVVGGRQEAVHSSAGTKAAAHCRFQRERQRLGKYDAAVDCCPAERRRARRSRMPTPFLNRGSARPTTSTVLLRPPVLVRTRPA